LKQIKNKKYYEPYVGGSRRVLLLGLVFFGEASVWACGRIVNICYWESSNSRRRIKPTQAGCLSYFRHVF